MKVTLTFNGTEKTLADWGAEIRASLSLTNQANDVFNLTIPTATLMDPALFPFEGIIVIKSYDDAGNPTVEFTGKRLREVIAASGSSVGVTYQFAGPWYDLEHTVYQQKTASYNNATQKIDYIYLSEAILFTRLDVNNFVVNCTNGQQIADILQFVIDTATAQAVLPPFQIGTIDPALNLPTHIIKPVMCSEAIRKCLELSPDCTFFFDYTTTPPTANCRARANMVPMTLPLFDGVSHKSVRIEPRPDLVAQAVRLFYKKENTINGKSQVTYDTDFFPADGLTAGLRVIVEVIDLAGFQLTTVSGSIDVEPVAAIGGTHTQKLAWWSNVRGGEQQVLSDLRYRFQDYTGLQTLIPDATIADEFGNTTNPATGNAWLVDYPNRVVDGAVHPWMSLTVPNHPSVPVSAQRLTIKMSVPVAQYDEVGEDDIDVDTGNLVHRWNNKEFACHVTLTNGTTGSYSAPATAVEAEATPVGIAQTLFASLAQLQYEGDFVRVQNAITGAPTMGNTLNLSNGRADWLGMNAQIQRLTKTYGLGYTEVSIGPAKHLNVQDLADLFNMWRYRRVWFNPNARSDPSQNGGNTEINKNTPKSNTVPASENPVDTTLSTGDTPADATIENHASVVATVTAGKMAVDPAHPPQKVKMVEVKRCDPETGLIFKCVMPAGGAYN